MNLEEQIYFSCAAYSSIHPNRAAVLNHLFCVLGNGYEWENGQLVECCGETTYRNGKPMTVKAAISHVFRRRKANAAFRKKEERKRKRDEKLHPEKYSYLRDDKIDDLIEKAIEAMKKAKEADPVGFEASRKREKAEFAAHKRKWREEEKWEYRVPADIGKRVKSTDFHHWYPISMDYPSNLANFPEDIRDEWLDAVIETARLIAESYERFEQGGPAFTDYGRHIDSDGSQGRKATRATYATANFALHRASEMKARRAEASGTSIQ